MGDRRSSSPSLLILNRKIFNPAVVSDGCAASADTMVMEAFLLGPDNAQHKVTGSIHYYLLKQGVIGKIKHEAEAVELCVR
ncbi:hypothetical protein E2562_033733 [Oryza meyeriana var. granulata]|uniref:Uncharacterized protein n=1 Tax=Oryza meyeriana var. granulata TaxID=110450 RepID=A0A6G1CKF9_9ORYZ|nr:hypothetical protein E2562_033733 [Oryza meyeriana var. granulata]